MRLTPAAIGWLAVWLFARVLMRPFLPDVPLTVCERCPQLLDAHGTTARVVTVSSANGGLFLGPIDRIGTKALPEGMQQIHRGGKLITDLKAAGANGVVTVGTNGFDGVLAPVSAAKIDNARFIPVDVGRTIGPVSRVGHYGILRDDRSYEAIRGALLLPR